MAGGTQHGEKSEPSGKKDLKCSLEELSLELSEVRSAALALASLSLSPIQTRSQEDEEVEGHFTFNTAQNRYRPIKSEEPSGEECSKAIEIEHKQCHSSCREERNEYAIKPRSFSQKDASPLNSQRELRKQRSYSFDAFGRANKYTNAQNKKHGAAGVLPLLHYPMICAKLRSNSGDEGLGSSSGSCESVEHLTGKRKHTCRPLFRCMWRGCSKEVTSLQAIILHVRHSHIGPSNAGEEEFYFDDINSSGVESSGDESTTEEEFPKPKLLKTSDDTMKRDSDHCQRMRDFPHVRDLFFCQQKPTEATQKSEIWSPLSPTTRKTVFPVCWEREPKRPECLFETHRYEQTPVFEHTPVSPVTPTNSPRPYAFGDPWEFPPSSFKDFIDKNLPATTRIFMPSSVPSSDLVSPTSARHAGRTGGKGKKKCRKVYGMTNKQLWCTQCKWKKACVRFT